MKYYISACWLSLFPFLIQPTLAATSVLAPAETLRSTNLSVAPVGILIGYANLAADFGIGESVTLGPCLSYSRFPLELEIGESISFGVQSVIFIGHRRFTDGWFVTPFIQWATNGRAFTLSGSGPALGADIGYWWFWENGINIGFGLGLKYMAVDFSNQGLSNARSGITVPNALVQMGYTL